jgi:N-methylhydantoinase A
MRRTYRASSCRHTRHHLAVGLLMTDITHPMVAPFIVPPEADLAAAERISRTCAMRPSAALEDGVLPAAISFRRYADMRYQGQAYELTIPCDEPLDGGPVAGDGALARRVASFHAHHERAYGHHAESEPTQFVNLRVEGVGAVPRGAWRERIASREERDRQRQVFVAGAGWLATPVKDRGLLEQGERHPGPLIVEQLDTTVWIPPGDVARIDEHGNIVVEVAT